MLPGRSGFDVLRALRSEGSSVGVLMLTARDDVIDRVAGLELGPTTTSTSRSSRVRSSLGWEPFSGVSGERRPPPDGAGPEEPRPGRHRSSSI